MALSKHVRDGLQLKIDQKIKIIALYAEDSTLNFRKFTEKVNFRLNISVSRAKKSLKILIHMRKCIFFCLIHGKIA